MQQSFIIANYHTHTTRCGHAEGADREYVEKAVELGFEQLGFADHLPVYRTPETNLPMPDRARIAEYCETLGKLRDEYADRIKIYIGFEVDYFAETFDEVLKALQESDADYMILGQHTVDLKGSGGTAAASDNEEKLKKYADNVITAISSGAFSYIAHPDVINFTGDDTVYTREMERICLAAKAKNIPLEINMLGAGGLGNARRHYPSERFFEIVGRVGNEVILGCDAHHPDMLGNREGYGECMRILNKFGIIPLSTLKINKP